VADFDRQGELISLGSLAPNFRAFNDLIAYLQAGSFFGYVREQDFDQFENILERAPSHGGCRMAEVLENFFASPRGRATLKGNGCQ
jgi:hypothetical protein